MVKRLQILVAGAIAIAVSAAITPSQAQGPQPVVSGTIEWAIEEAPGFGNADHAHEGDHDDHEAGDVGEGRVVAYLVTDRGRVLDLDPALAQGLATGDRVTAQLSAGASSVRSLRPTQRTDVMSRARTTSGRQLLPYALVAVRAPDTTGTPATLEDARRWLLDATQSFFDREAAEAFEFSIHSTHQLTLESSSCRREREAVQEARDRLAIPSDVGIILVGHNDACSYAGLAVVGSARAGHWIVFNYESPSRIPADRRAFYEEQGREVMIHEVGHNLGLLHSKAWKCRSGISPYGSAAGDCDYWEYGSESSVMGSGPEGTALDAYERWQLGVYGSGRTMSVQAGSGTALLIDDRRPVIGPDSGQLTEVGGVPLLRAVHLRESGGEVWLTAREPVKVAYTDFTLTPGIVAHHRAQTPISRWIAEPMQLDLVPAPPDGAEYRDNLAGYHDIAVPGTRFTTPGGTQITVGSPVMTSEGRAFPVSWVGASPSGVVPAAPQVEWDYELQSGVTPWLTDDAVAVVIPEVTGDAESCRIVDSSGATVAEWSSVPLAPIPSPSWWSSRTAWSPSARKEAQAGWRFPLLGDVPEGDLVADVDVASGTTHWRSQCRDFLGRMVESQDSTTVRVDRTAPRVTEGSLAVLGLESYQGRDHSQVVFRVQVPAFADDESGLASREGACSHIPPGESGECVEEAWDLSGRIMGAAEDVAGNTSDYLRANYAVKSVPAIKRSTSAWSASYDGSAVPRRKGAKTTVTVRGRSAAVSAECGPGTGRLEIRINGGKPIVAKLAQGDCSTAFPLPSGTATLTITYKALGSGIDRLNSVQVLL